MGGYSADTIAGENRPVIKLSNRLISCSMPAFFESKGVQTFLIHAASKDRLAAVGALIAIAVTLRKFP
jgi:hypothetical protein